MLNIVSTAVVALPNILDPMYWIGPQGLFASAVLPTILVIVFVETGLLFPLLPGESLLFTGGLLAAHGTLDIWVLAPCVAAAAVLEGLGLGYGAWAWHAYSATAQAPYVTLTSPAPSYRDGPRIRVVFRSGLSVASLGAMLHQAGAHIIDGPTDSNVYTLGFTGSDVTAQVIERRAAALRASSDVLFAEPLGAGTDPR